MHLAIEFHQKNSLFNWDMLEVTQSLMVVDADLGTLLVVMDMHSIFFCDNS